MPYVFLYLKGLLYVLQTISFKLLERSYLLKCMDPNIPPLAGMKYDLRRVEEVYYDVKIRGLTPNGEFVGDERVQRQS